MSIGASMSVSGFVAVGVGAAIGAWVRWGLSLWLNTRHAQFPYGTLAANLIGGYLVGLAVAYFSQSSDMNLTARLFVITGFLGGLTTFSTYSAEVVSLLQRGEPGWALTVAGGHLAGSLLLTALGFMTYRAFA